MMTGPLIMAALWSLRPAVAFTPATTTAFSSTKRASLRLFSSASSSTIIAVENCVSRLSTLKTLISKHGVPGSRECHTGENDLEPIEFAPELVSALTGPDEELANLHPYLYPIAKSQTSGTYVCAYRNPYLEETGKKHPWPIVEARLGGPGMSLLALNSEHLMRRIVCECDFAETDQDLIKLYNEGLGQGLLSDAALDAPYETGSVAKLGYGVDKYVLLRVGPFPDLYQTMAKNHLVKGDEQSSLIAAEACNSKLPGFGSNFAYYARLLSSLPNRVEETRDAARMCLRMPLPTMGLTMDDFKEVAVLGLMADQDDSTEVAVEKLKAMYEKMREVEREEDPNQGKTPVQMAIDEANYILDSAVLDGKEWKETRPAVGKIFREAGLEDMADFVDNR